MWYSLRGRRGGGCTRLFHATVWVLYIYLLSNRAVEVVDIVTTRSCLETRASSQSQLLWIQLCADCHFLTTVDQVSADELHVVPSFRRPQQQNKQNNDRVVLQCSSRRAALSGAIIALRGCYGIIPLVDFGGRASRVVHSEVFQRKYFR